MDISTLIRITFFGCMLAAFLLMFGLPAWRKYRDEATTLEHLTVTSENGNIMPAITVCPFRRYPNRTAWKNGIGSLEKDIAKILKKECPSKSKDQFMACLKAKLYHRRDEISLKAWVRRNLAKNWDLRYRGGFFGICHTFHYPDPVGTEITEDPVEIKFDQKLSYYVFIHDPNFFLPTYNPSTFPSTIMTYKENITTWRSFFVEVKKYVRMQPCQPDFAGCLEGYVNREIGCSMFENVADTSTDGSSTETKGSTLPQCNSVSQVLHMDRIINELATATQREMLNITGCRLPCEHRRYRIRDNPATSSTDNGMRINFSSKDMEVITQVELYPFQSFLAEFGGALGLFTGFSFMFFADLADWVLKVFVKGGSTILK